MPFPHVAGTSRQRERLARRPADHTVHRPMDYDETLQFLREQAGKWVEVSVGLLVADRDEPAHIAGFSGQVADLSRSGARALPEAWYVRMAEHDNGPSPGQVRFDRALFEDAQVEANVVEEPEDRTSRGATWTLTVRQRDVVTAVLVYV